MIGATEAGLYWQSRMGNNHDGIGGNCHRYDVVTKDRRGALSHRRLLVDYGIKMNNDQGGYACSFTAPDGLFAKRDAPTPAPDAEPLAEALLLTHCHEDHIGAIKHAIDMGYRLPPVHCTAFTAEMLQKSLIRGGIIAADQRPEIHVVKPGKTVRLAGADVTFVPVDHLPGASALLLRTDDAAIFHSGDYKFDATLPLGTRADPEQLREIGRRGVDLVIADSTAAGDPGAKIGEAEIERNLTRMLADQRGRAVVAGLLGSQLDRLVSLGRAAAANHRALVITGAALGDNIQAAERAGHSLEKAIGAPLLTAAQAKHLTADRALVVTTGAFAQPMAGLTRAAEQQPGALYIGDDTTVIIPQRAIPPVAEAHGRMVERLERLGARVISAENSEKLGYGVMHQSGHAIAADTKLLYSLLQPRQAVSPMHGAPKQIDANAAIAESLGIRSLPLPANGVIVKVNRQGATALEREEIPRIGAIETGNVKQLPRARPGEGRRPAPPAVYRYDRLDEKGQSVIARDVDPHHGPARAARSR
jgi:ribonuclease J